MNPTLSLLSLSSLLMSAPYPSARPNPRRRVTAAERDAKKGARKRRKAGRAAARR